MDYFGKLLSSVHTFYNDINPATLSGAIDIIVVEQDDQQWACSPFHVRFGKLNLFNAANKKVTIKVNDEIVPYSMKVSEAGEAFFVFETDHDVPEEYQTSPLLDATESDDPPFLDLGEASQKEEAPVPSKLDDLDEEEEETDEQAPELQSPKMIIQEQTDRMITHLDSSTYLHQHDDANPLSLTMQDLHLDNSHSTISNDAYHLQDGSTLLERVLPERVSSETLTRETFIVRPVDGHTDTLWMEVTRTTHAHHAIWTPPLSSSSNDDHAADVTNKLPATSVTSSTSDTSSIFLDIAGYKMIDAEEAIDKHAAISSTPSPSSSKYSGQHNASSSTTLEQHALGTAPATPWQWEENRDTIHVKEGQSYIVQISTCGFSAFGSDQDSNAKVFASHQISFGTFVQNPNILNDKNLVFKHNDKYYAAAASGQGPLFTTLLVFRQPMLPAAISSPANPSSASATLSPSITAPTTSADLAQDPQADASTTTYRFGRGWSQWFRRSSVKAVVETPAFDHSIHEKTDGPDQGHHQHTTTYTTTTTATTVGIAPSSAATSDLPSTSQPVAAATDLSSNAAASTGIPLASADVAPAAFSRRRYVKTLRLTSDQLKSLGLKKGVNTVSYSVTSSYQGTATCSAKIFLWDASVKVVISDIDGTITKSDALGHVFTMIGKDWTHMGVAKLYTDIHHNGYQFLYLTSRAIGQADYTRDYLKRVLQNDYQLPDGPVLMSPDRLFTSFHREVIVRKPEVFKMACLKDIQRLFVSATTSSTNSSVRPSVHEAFYAGFGNRVTDGISYRSVGVPASRIFTIDPYGQLRLELLRGFQSSYVDLHAIVDQMFPPLTNDNQMEDQTYNDWNFWKAPLPTVDLPLPVPTSPTTTPSSPTSPALSTMSLPLPSTTPISPKPIPIVPDISKLPKSAVIDASPRPEKQSLLRRLTSRTSLLSTSPPPTSTSSSSSLSSRPSSPPIVSQSTPMPKRSNTSANDSPSSSSLAHRNQPKELSFDLLDDDAFDATLDALEDEIDMDSIPFI
ncbi:LNS2-domain-containing protein [Hesseltinella vesiculosa]|uniref:phosphatidate phosphatase n=1 Tax=Hesseltinella vesiculosa TaxID=101127 RepID=A0A1X2GBS9_9FUNG|nr:LNS2-domain-containing protein [Hesseltinella vesiculosa]